jgi:hypothetical protein
MNARTQIICCRLTDGSAVFNVKLPSEPLAATSEKDAHALALTVSRAIMAHTIASDADVVLLDE